MPKFFFALFPPPSISEEIRSFQQELKEKYGFNHALKTPPHLTVIPPFHSETEKLISISERIKQHNFKPFSIGLNGFQAFIPRVVFVDVARNNELNIFQKQLQQLLAEDRLITKKANKHDFTPHITIANRDLNNKTFKEIFPEFQKRAYRASFQANSIVLLELVNGIWKVKEELFFS